MGLQATYAAMNPKGPKTEAEDRMVGFYPHCEFNLNPRAASIDTPLHSFIGARDVDHMHPNSIIAIAAAKRSKELTAEIFGGEMAWTPWLRPGLELGLELQRIFKSNPKLKGVVLGQHGVINWADGGKECYDVTLNLIERAAEYIEARDKGDKTFGGAKYSSLSDADRDEILFELLPWLRGQVSQERRFVATIHSDATILRFVNSNDAPRLAGLGTSCPDHFLRTKIKPLYADWNPAKENVEQLKQKLTAGMEQYRKDYADYYNRCKHPNSPAMRQSNPTVMLIPGIGMIAWGKDKSESRVTAEFYNCAVEVMRGAEAIDEYIALPQQEAFDIEYWLLEEAKLKRMPRGKRTGAANCDCDWRGKWNRQRNCASTGKRRRANYLRGFECRCSRGHRERTYGFVRRGHRRSGHGNFRMRPSHRPAGEYHGSRERPRNVEANNPGVRRSGFDRRDRRNFCAAGQHRPHDGRTMEAHF